MIAILLETAATLFIVVSTFPIVCFVIGSYLLATMFIKDITKNDFFILKDEISSENPKKLNESIRNIMQNFSEIKQLGWDSNLSLLIVGWAL